MRYNKWIFGALLGLVAVLAPVSAQVGWCPMCSGYGGYGIGIFGWIIMTLVAIAVILFIIWLIRQLSKK